MPARGSLDLTDIARVQLLGVTKDGVTVPVSLGIGAPQMLADCWQCSVTLEGIDPGTVHIFGEDGLQSLCLAIRYMKHRLTDFVEKGGQLFYSDGKPPRPDSEFPVEAYFGNPG